MRIIKSVKEMQAWSQRARRMNFSVGFVPTMGALHEGHLSLVERSRHENDVTVASIFVNPLQFGPKEDYKKYPRPIAKDVAMLKTKKVDVVFLPSANDMYPAQASMRISAGPLGTILEGASRPGH